MFPQARPSVLLPTAKLSSQGRSDLSWTIAGQSENGRFDPRTPNILKLFSDVAELQFVLM